MRSSFLDEHSVGSTSSDLLKLARERSGDAWQRLVDMYGPLVYRWIRQDGLQSADAADVFQEVFAAVNRSLDRFQHDQDNSTFRGWLRTITRNKVLDHLRRQGKRLRAVGGTDFQERLEQQPAEPGSSSAPLASSGMPTDVKRCLAVIQEEFAANTWQAFWRVVVLGEATSDVAQALGMSTNNVRQARSRVLRRLREMLGADGPGAS